jgi:predicted AlkP superfamily phosphohydrolase/phosphomutase/Tfp pilus assembly protein PilF
MFRRRWFRALVLLACLAGLLYIVASLYLPSSRKLIVGVNKRTGYVHVVDARVAFLPPHEYYRLAFDKRNGLAQRDGFIRTLSQDQVPVTVNYRLRFSIAPGQRLPDARTLIDEGWRTWLDRRVAEAVDAVTQHVSIEELLAPTSQFNSQRDPLRRTVAGYLARSGLNVTAFEIARMDADHDALLRVKRAELRRSARGVAGRVAIFAVDGADWDLISELASDDRIPNLKALSRGGATANVQTIQPTVSPMLWTTVATGLSPGRHGVIDFVDRTRNVPVDAQSRHAPALWDIAEAFGRHAMTVNWWTDWPPTAAGAFFFDAPVDLRPDAIYPADAALRAHQLEVPLQTVGYEQVRRFLNITPGEYQQAVDSNNPRDPVNIFRGILAKTWTDHRVAINFYREQQPLLFMMSYDGTDAVDHLFGPFHPPYRQSVSQDGYRRYWPAVSNYYSEIDRLIGEWMTVLPADTTVIIMSAHGFVWGKARPTAMPNGGAALADHSRPGIFIAYGSHASNDHGMRTLSVYDIAPAALAILGLPQSAEMPGSTPEWAFRDIKPVTSVRVVSYAEFISVRPLPAATAAEPKQYRAELQAIGHLNDPSRKSAPVLEDSDQPTVAAKPLPPERWGSYAYYNNLGVTLRKQGKVKEACDAFGEAIQINPHRPTPYLNLAMASMDRQQYAAADEAFVQAVANGLPNADRWFVDYAALYRERNMSSRAIALLYKGKAVFPQSYEIAANLGSALAASERYTEGLPELERALGLQPSSTLALNNIGMFYAKRNDYARALDFWNRSLAIDPHQPQIRAAAEAARSRL